MKTLLFTCVLLPWLVAAFARKSDDHSQLIPGPLHDRELTGYFSDHLESSRDRRALPLADEPDATPKQEGTEATDLPTCLLCVCLTGSLPYRNIMTLRRIDLTRNMISEIEDGAFSKLIMLEQLSLAENRLVKLPMLPAKLTTFNANNNFLKTKGVKANVFKKMTNLVNLHLANNQLEAVPFIPDSVRILHLQNNNITDVNISTFCRSNDTYYLRPSLSEVRLDGNPVMLSKYPDSFTCMHVLPIGQYR
uniref:Uncharacterized protein n=1 Tax=Mola mola TaxID=94237 RepID=A0A3Q4BFB5_MOLML